MESLSENSNTILYISIPVTVVIVVASLIYTFRNIMRIWNAGDPHPSKDLAENDSADEDNEMETEDKTEDKKNDQKKPGIDPVQYCEHIQSEVKKARQRVANRELNKKMTPEDIENEREIQRKQMEDIFKLMEQNQDKFGSASKEEMQQQMRLYV